MQLRLYRQESCESKLEFKDNISNKIKIDGNINLKNNKMKKFEYQYGQCNCNNFQEILIEYSNEGWILHSAFATRPADEFQINFVFQKELSEL